MMKIYGAAFVFSVLVHIALGCQSYDTSVQDWGSGRRGKLLLPAGIENNYNIEIQLSNNANSLNFDCLYSKSSSGSTFVFQMNYWCMKSAGRLAFYTMQYVGQTKVVFVSIKIDGVALCDGSSPATPAPSGLCEDYVKINTKTSTYKQVSLMLKKDFGLDSDLLEMEFDHPVTFIRCWRVKILENQGNKSFKMQVKAWIVREIKREGSIEFLFNIRFKKSEPTPNIVSIQFNNFVCPKGPTATTQPPLVTLGGNTCASYINTVDNWPGGEKVVLELPVSSALSSWKVTVGFDPPQTLSLSIPNARSVLTDNCLLYFENYGYNKDISAGELLSLEYVLNYDQTKPKPKLVYIELGNSVWSKNCGKPPVCPTTPMPSTTHQQTTEDLTTQEPEVTTELPEVTTQQPEITTESPPGVTTQQPEVTTQQPEVTTQQPESTTEGPPEVTTQKPKVTSTSSQCLPKYDYKEVLHKSLLFYEAQRSGPLPTSNRIPWRQSSTISDGSEVGQNLTGGYFDAGDFVKFTFPGAAAITMLAWGMVEYSDGYKFAKEYENGLEAIKWATDFFLKCHTGPTEFWGQVGNGNIDHAFWGRASDLTTSRPCYVLNKNNPGSDLVGEVAASLAASSIVFKDADISYSNKILQHAEELYDFANDYEGMYSDSIADAKTFYNSWSGYKDELAWAAAWLYKATGKKKYLTDAETHWNDNGMQKDAKELSWDNKGRGVAILMAGLTNNQKYVQNAMEFCTWLQNGAPKTPQGMVFLQIWGSNRHAANVAFACLVLSKYVDSADYVDFSRKQIHMLLGDAGRSYVVGFGLNPPQRPHHSGSSCPDRPASCNWNNFNSPDPNPQILYGALVGGPAQNGIYEDKRTDYVKNEVTIDYNAGFQSALAGLSHLQSTGNCGSY